MSNEKPEYTVLLASDMFEVRRYEPMIIAKTRVSGSLDNASSAGFKQLANYIFGNNTSQTGDSEKISMTAPVMMEPISEQINMTAPVTLQQSHAQWEVSFYMPRQYTMATLPRPNSTKVTLIEIPSKTYAVIRFSGLTGAKKLANKTQALYEWIKKQQLTPIAEPEIARYNAPWTLPFMRRNEVMLELKSGYLPTTIN